MLLLAYAQIWHVQFFAIPVAYFFLKFLNGIGPFNIVPESVP